MLAVAAGQAPPAWTWEQGPVEFRPDGRVISAFPGDGAGFAPGQHTNGPQHGSGVGLDFGVAQDEETASLVVLLVASHRSTWAPWPKTPMK